MGGKSTLGTLLEDAVGVGPEIIVKLAASRFHGEYCRPVVVGDIRALERGTRICDSEVPAQVIDKVEEADWTKGMPVLDQGDMDPEQAPLVNINIESGRACPSMLKTVIELCQAGRIDGFCFVPLNRQAVTQAGRFFKSEYHYMTHPFGYTEPFGEINALGDLWTTRTIGHIPISKVSDGPIVDTIMRAIRLADASPGNSGTEKPKLAPVALNLHCGEGGKCGRERIDVIASAIEKAREMRVNTNEPLPFDALFIRAFNGDFDGAATIHHDQSQTAFKPRGFGQGITVAGRPPVPIVTCAHGTTYDIAGKGIVRTSTFESVIKMAAKTAAHLRGH